MEFRPTKIPDVVLLVPKVFGDDRGFFLETFRADEFARECASVEFVQDNHSRSTRGILRGLHYQNPRPQGKLVRVTAGEVYDVVVDLREGSPTFGQHISRELSARNREQLYVPEGFAHGFCTLEPDTEVIYKVTDYYAPKHDHGILWNDPALGIDWPVTDPLLSDKDRTHPRLADLPEYFAHTPLVNA